MVDINPSDEIDIFSLQRYDWEGGRSFYLNVCRNIEMMSDISGLTFYISARTPSRLPRYGRDVVLLLLADELYAHLQVLSLLEWIVVDSWQQGTATHP
jgi:hypothetical protein